MRVLNKRRNLTTVLISLTFALIFTSFIPILPVNKNNPLILPPGTLAIPNEPGNPYSPVDDEQVDLSTLSNEYPSPSYTGSGPSYTVAESFNEVVKQSALQSGLKYGNNININLDANFPSQDASRLYGTI